MAKLRFVLLLVALCSIALPQVKVLLYDFEPRGVELGFVKTNTQLLRDALNGTYKFIVVDPRPGTSCYGVVAAAESARVYGADNALVGNIMSIGGQQIMTYQLVDASSGALVLQDRVTLPDVQELPVVAERVASSLAEKKPYAETVEPEKMTSAEVGPRFKHPRQPYASLFLTAGYQFHPAESGRDSMVENYSFSPNLFNLNMAVSFETQQMLTMLQMGLMRGRQGEADINFDLLSHYVLGKSDFAPIMGGGIGVTRFSWRDTTKPDNKAHDDGMSVSAGVGFLALRTYYFRLMTTAYGKWTFTNQWGAVPSVRVAFGVTTPTLGPDATVRMGPGCVGAVIGGFFITGLVIALAS
ncbi:MAG: hypothetical protein ABIL25_06120 [candidate division WOR-3 bacterium]